MKHALLQTLLVLAAAGAPTGASGQATSKEPAYPTKPIYVVVPAPPGGTTDIQGRMLAEKLAQRLDQPIVIDNRPGGSTSIGMGVVARAPADGYMLIIAPVGGWAVNPHLYRLPYDVSKDIAPIIHVSTNPGVLVVHPSLPVKTVKELIALARQKPGELNYGSGGEGSFGHISAELFAAMTKTTRMTHVPYKGAAQPLTALVGGHIHMLFNSAVPTVPHVKSGRVRALATTGATRLAILPNLPTVAEAGVSGYENTTWQAIGAPARTPRAIIERLNKELNAILQMPDIQERFAAGGSTITGGTPEQFRDYLKSELAKFSKLIKEAGIKAAAGS